MSVLVWRFKPFFRNSIRTYKRLDYRDKLPMRKIITAGLLTSGVRKKGRPGDWSWISCPGQREMKNKCFCPYKPPAHSQRAGETMMGPLKKTSRASLSFGPTLQAWRESRIAFISGQNKLYLSEGLLLVRPEIPNSEDSSKV